MKLTFSPLLAVLIIILAGCTSGQTVSIKDLRVEMKENPVGIGVSQPRFMWKISSGSPDLTQTSYQIQVAESPDNLKNGKELLWDSGEVKSDESILIPYGGNPLQSRKQYYWRIKANTNQGSTDWSPINTWSMTLLNPSDWKATWIGENNLSNPGETKEGKTRLAARYLRKEFVADKPIQRAVLYISGLGFSESYINGKTVSEDIFAPGPSWYPNRVYYNVYDVTDLLSKDKNTIGVALGNGRYFAMRDRQETLPSLLAQLEIEYADGSQTVIVSDTSWKVTSKGPIIANNEFDGEEYDARLELSGWNKNGFDDSKWLTADVMTTPAGKLTVQSNPNLRIQEEIKPVSITERPDGKYIIDMGQNMVGRLAVSLKGKKDQPVTMKFAELLKEDGSLYLANLRSANVTDIYTPARDGQFSWEPIFVYHGFRFVEISGLDYKPELSAFTGKVIYDKKLKMAREKHPCDCRGTGDRSSGDRRGC